MKGKHYKKLNEISIDIKKIWTIFLSALMIINIALALSNGTNSSFSRTFSGDLQIKAGTGEDIISGFNIVSSDNKVMSASSSRIEGSRVINPLNIEVQKAEGLDYYPVVYFTVEGDATDFIHHINPIVMDSKSKNIPLEVNFNLQNYIKLIEGKSKVEGTVNIRTLNGSFVNKTMKIEFTKDYLISQYCKELGIDEGDKDTLPNVIALLARYKSWNQVIVDSSGSIKIQNVQRTIVDKVAPGLIEGMSAQIKDRDAKIKELTEKINSMEVLQNQNQLESVNVGQ